MPAADHVPALDDGERLSRRLDAFVREHGVGAGGAEDPAWQELLHAIGRARPHRYALLGRPAFLTEAQLADLAAEARVLQASAEPPSHDAAQAGQLSAPPGPVARRLVVNAGWRALCSDALGIERRPPYTAGYLYYDGEGAGIVPHVDDPEFGINVLVMVSRSGGGERRSATVLHPAGQAPVRVVLEPGEAVILEADGLVHAREPMQPGERVTVLTMGLTRGQSPTTA